MGFLLSDDLQSGIIFALGDARICLEVLLLHPALVKFELLLFFEGDR
jgi:hypothetical protein